VIQKSDWEQYFPYATPRSEQEIAINFILNAFLVQKKRYVIAELATGIGKSAIGITVARYLRSMSMTHVTYGLGAYILTGQKVLQEQYIRDFGEESQNLMRSIKSSNNYTCVFHTEQKCSESRRVLQTMKQKLLGTPFYDCCNNNCPYKLAKQSFLESDIGVTNFSYFLAETKYAHQLKERSFIVIDECHGTEQALSSFIEVIFSERFAKDVLCCKLLSSNPTQAQVFTWVRDVYYKFLKKKISSLAKKIEIEMTQSDDMTLATANSKQYEMLDKHECKINRFIEAYEHDNWVMNVVENVMPNGRKHKRFEFKPVDVSRYCKGHLFDFGIDHILMMSATVVNKDAYCRTIGLNQQDVEYIYLQSPFAVENRKIHYIPSGSMSMRVIDKTLPVLVEAIKLILENHKLQKGIIHCTNYKIARFIKENLHDNRLLLHDAETREQVLNEHIQNVEPTVLLSPSMTEGVDLSDESSRFQILCKVPYPCLGDAVVRRRMEKDKSWYVFQTIKTIIQALGRSVRNENDYAVSYILDSDWKRFYETNKCMFPIDFHKLLEK